MKKFIKILSLALAVSLVCLVLASCAETLSGVYSNGASGKLVSGNVSYAFSGKKVTVTATVGIAGFEKDVVYEGTYEIGTDEQGAGQITFTFETTDDDGVSTYSGNHSFSQNKDAKTITIDGVTYTKA